MALEPIGAVVLAVGLICLFRAEEFSYFALIIATLLGASAGVFLTIAGNANIQPAHLLLCILSLDLLMRRSARSAALDALAFPRAGFWLLLAVIYGAIVTVVMPRLFEGATFVFNLAQAGSDGASIVLNPLGPVSANFTQVIYLLGGLVCFLLFAAYASDRHKLDGIAKAVIACALVNCAFAVLDVTTYFSGTSYLLDPIRNSSYRILDAIELGGLKRIVGSFPEASSFAYATIGLFGFTFELWLRGLYRPYAGLSASLSLLGLLASTSSAGYLGGAGFICWQYSRCVLQILRCQATPNGMRFVIMGPIVVAIVLCAALLIPPVGESIQGIFDIVVLNKLDSASGVERTAWNSQALIVFADTSWLGAGIGSVRASSWPIAVLASVGLIGAILYGTFIVRLLTEDRRLVGIEEGGVVSAAQALCVAQLITSAVAVSFVDLGLLFFALAGVVCGAGTSKRSTGFAIDGRRGLRYAVEGRVQGVT